MVLLLSLLDPFGLLSRNTSVGGDVTTKKDSKTQLGLFNANADLNTNVNAPTTNIQNTYSTQETYNTNYAPVDARTYQTTTNSPYATTKKSDSISGGSLTADTGQAVEPAFSGSGSSPSLGLAIPDVSSSISTILLIGGLGIGAFLLLKSGGKK